MRTKHGAVESECILYKPTNITAALSSSGLGCSGLAVALFFVCTVEKLREETVHVPTWPLRCSRVQLSKGRLRSDWGPCAKMRAARRDCARCQGAEVARCATVVTIPLTIIAAHAPSHRRVRASC